MANGHIALPLDHLTDRELLLLAVQQINDLKRELSDQSRRVRSLEAWRYGLSGAVAVLATISSWIMAKLP